MSTFANFAIKDREALKRYILVKLGYPIQTVELSDEQLEVCIDDATELYSKYANIDQEYFILNLGNYIPNVGYELSAEVVGVFALERDGSGNDFGNLYAIDNSLLYSVMNYMTPLPRMFSFATFELVKQYMDMVDIYAGKGFDFNFNDRTKILKLIPDPTTSYATSYKNMSILIGAYVVRPETQLYGEYWVKSMALAQAKILLGTIRKKFASVPLIGGGTIDTSIGEEGIKERDELIANLQSTEAPVLSFIVR